MYKNRVLDACWTTNLKLATHSSAIYCHCHLQSMPVCMHGHNLKDIAKWDPPQKKYKNNTTYEIYKENAS